MTHFEEYVMSYGDWIGRVNEESAAIFVESVAVVEGVLLHAARRTRKAKKAGVCFMLVSI
jgi:hypothetical protein